MKRILTSLLAASAVMAATGAIANDADTYHPESSSMNPPIEQSQDLQVDRSFGNWGTWDSNRDNAASPRTNESLDSNSDR
ncbi:hypothetical protein [Chitiniphilus eburneus]|uniref:Uncharacterized protein n=1 Tax=Chitiniphilus eburneus TaxID=2571148 RepID=A0A4U0PX63_9NEIS|nr:hypothetical protein [Chitiniphilus eburneus]TJZ73151.1 hypothetical protein FAZ21_11055 [Chitiniphilus eburneus]